MNQFGLYNEKAILARVEKSDESAFRVLYDHYRNKVVTIAFKVLQSEPEVLDALQEIFIKIWVGRNKLAAIENFNAYLNTVTRNHLSNVMRRRLLERAVFSEIAEIKSSEARHASDPATLRQLQDILYRAIHGLPRQQRKVFELSRLQGVKQEEIADQLHISRETVKRHLAEASRKLKTVLNTYNDVILPLVIIHFLK